MIVTSESMEANPNNNVSAYKIQSAPKGSAVFVKGFDADKKQQFYDELAVGDVITFNYFDAVNRKNVTVTHRVVEKTEYNNSGVYHIVTHGDNNPNEINESFSSNDNVVYGKVTRVDVTFGKLLSFLQTAKGITFVIIIPTAVIMIIEILKLIWVISNALAERKAKAMTKDYLREAVDIISENDENEVAAETITNTVNSIAANDNEEKLLEPEIPDGPIPHIAVSEKIITEAPVFEAEKIAEAVEDVQSETAPEETPLEIVSEEATPSDVSNTAIEVTADDAPVVDAVITPTSKTPIEEAPIIEEKPVVEQTPVVEETVIEEAPITEEITTVEDTAETPQEEHHMGRDDGEKFASVNEMVHYLDD